MKKLINIIQMPNYRAYHYRVVHRVYEYPTDKQWVAMAIGTIAVCIYLLLSCMKEMTPHYSNF